MDGNKDVLKEKGAYWMQSFYQLPFFLNSAVWDSWVQSPLQFTQENYRLLKKMWKQNLKRPTELTCYFFEKYDYQNYKMDVEELKEYNMAQIEEMKKYKAFLEAEENREVPMEEVVMIWAEKYSQSFRKYWHLKKSMDLF